jgi:polysaccharide transporter, PST family
MTKFVQGIAGIGARVASHGGAHNFAWLVADRGLRLVVSLVIGSWVIRYLGATQFGLFAYASAWIAIVGGISSLGMDALVVRDIIKRPEQAGMLIGTTIGFRLLTSLFGSLVVLGFVCIFRPDQPLVWGLVALLGVGAVFQTLESGELWYQSRIQMWRLVLPRLALFFVINGLKVILILHGAGLVAFVGVSAVEWMASGLLTFVFVRWEKTGLGRLTFNLEKGRLLLGECWPLALSGLMVILYMKISQLMLAGMLNNAALGVYSAAIRIPEAANFFPIVLASSLLPSLLRHRDQGPVVDRAARLRFYRLNVLIAIALCLPLSIGSPWIVRLLYGHKFQEAVPIMAVYAWTLLFVFLGVARAQCLLNERRTKCFIFFTVCGLLVNVGLNLLMIPRFGPLGAAWASVLAYAVAALGSSFFLSETRQIGQEQLFAIVTPWRALERVT